MLKTGNIYGDLRKTYTKFKMLGKHKENAK